MDKHIPEETKRPDLMQLRRTYPLNARYALQSLVYTAFAQETWQDANALQPTAPPVSAPSFLHPSSVLLIVPCILLQSCPEKLSLLP
uniref:Transcription factor AS1 isoform X1 n=1 Tax=Rhizophora mucronata TaxID=61149 RepID=A0A2P2QCH7_RHIMU